MKLKNGKYQYKEGHITETGDMIECDATFWYKNDKLHRKNGPAIEYTDGGKEWYLNGLLHREDGPAVEKADGTKGWYLNGLLHREDGPALDIPDGTQWWKNENHIESSNKQWFLNGLELTEEEFNHYFMKKELKNRLQINLPEKLSVKKNKI